jgi:hypothetical protein
MIADGFRVLRPGGWFVMLNICPCEMQDWAIYRYFPAALECDLDDFMPQREIEKRLREVGFEDLKLELDHQECEEELDIFAATVRRRDICSQLIGLSEAAYQAGLNRLELELQRVAGGSVRMPTESCLLKIIAKKLERVKKEARF